MGVQVAEREKHSHAPVAKRVFPVTNTISGFEGARFITTVSGAHADTWGATTEGYILSSNANATVFVGAVYHAGVEEFDPDFVADVLAADVAEPEARFNNVVAMLDWLNRA